jgi:hypothetical protein
VNRGERELNPVPPPTSWEMVRLELLLMTPGMSVA